MEQVFVLYARLYDPKRPVICFDERPCFLIGDVVVPIFMSAGKPKREDYCYTKHGSCALLMAFEPHAGRRWAKVYERRTAKEYTLFMQRLSEQLPEAETIELAQDNLNTHQGGSFYAHLLPEDAFALCERFEMHFPPRVQAGFNAIEIEFSALARQRFNRHIPCQKQLEHEVLAWVEARNAKCITFNWQFPIQSARGKLKRHYQTWRKT